MKKDILLTLIALFCVVLYAQAGMVVQIGDLYYELYTNTATVTSPVNSSPKNIYIHSTVTYFSKTYSVTSIRDRAFYNCESLTSITIPNGVTSIGSSAFYGCTGLTSITIPNSVTSIGSSAFEGCTGLSNISVPGSVETIEENTFAGCTGLTTVVLEYGIKNLEGRGYRYTKYGAFKGCSSLVSIIIPESVTNIGSCTFCDCTSIPSITIPNSVTGIGAYAFYGCTSLTSVTIPNSVTSIGESAFYKCTGLKSVTIGDSVTSIGNIAFSGCTSLTSVTIGNSVTNIGDSAFYECTGLTSVAIPNSVTSIGDYAFYNCSGLKSITMGNSVTSIGDRAFFYCTGLTSVTIPNSVTSIGYEAFYRCWSLKSITIGNSVTSIGGSAFYGCTGLVQTNYTGDIASWCAISFRTSFANPIYYSHNVYINGTKITDLMIPDSVTSIGDYAFFDCTSLTSVTIGNSVTSIGYEAFSGCTGLKSVIMGNSVTSIGDYAFYGCTRLTSVTIPNSVTSIGKLAFYKCTGLTSVTIGNSVTSIESSVFEGCTGLTSITIPNSVTSIGYEAFYGCTGLTSVTIGNSVTSIGSSAFSVCTGLTSVTIPNSVTSIGQRAFNGCTGLTSVTIGDSVTSIGYDAFYRCTGLTSIVVASGNTIYDSRENCNAIIETSTNTLIQGCKATTIPNSVTSIGESAFYSCTGFTSITIPNSVTSIGDYAFYNCTGLTSVIIGNSVTSIGESAFYNVPNIVYNGTATGSPWGARSINGYVEGYLVYADAKKTTLLVCSSAATDITIPNSVTSIRYNAFRDCTDLSHVVWNVDEYRYIRSLTATPFVYGNDFDIRKQITSFVFGKEVDNIPNCLCNGMSNLTSITIPDGVTSIGQSAFYGCTGLKSVIMGNSVTSIGAYAFRGCTALTSVTIPNSVTSIEEAAFYDCTGLTSITIPNSVTSIERDAFRYCTGLTYIRVEAQTPPQCNGNGNYTFYNVPKNIPVYVPCGTKDAYQNSAGWSSFTNIVEEREYSVTIRSSANGSAEMLSYTCDNELTIRGTANTHYHFIQWSDGDTDNPRTFVVFQDTTLTAEFAIDQHNIGATAQNGCVEGAGTYDYGSTATLTAVADEHYHFERWNDGNTDNPRTFVVFQDTSLTATFAPYQYAISATAENGDIEGAGTYDYGTSITLTAVANEHYHFTQWNDGNTDNPRTVSVEGDATYTAVFAPNQYTISSTAENGRVEGTGKYDYGTTATLTAIANEHYHFVRWSDGNIDNPRTITIEGDATYTAEFAIDQFTITATCDIQYGEVTGDGVYDYGTRITLTAIPNSGYEFKQWSNGLTYNPYRFTVVSDLTLEAEFIPATAIDNIYADMDTITPLKVLINGQVYILRGGKTYTTTGLEVN